MKKLLRVLSLITLILFVSGCEPKPQPPKKPIIDESLPVVANIRYLSDITEVGLEWKPVYDERVSGYYIYRSNPKKIDGKLQRIAKLEDKYISHFVDTNLKPETQYHYKMSTYSNEKRESVASTAATVNTQPNINSVAFIKAIAGLPHRVKLIWRPHPSKRVKSYIIQRSEFSSTTWEELARVDGRLNAEYIDGGLEDNKFYKYRIQVKTYDGLLSKHSEIVEAGTKPLPQPIEKLYATGDLPKKISLQWQASANKDFSYYKVYRAINPLLFYSYRAKTVEPRFDDLVNANGKTYYYKVTAVDKDGLESIRQESPVAGSTLGIPLKPVVTTASHDGRSINITWESEDKRAMKYNLIKSYNSKKDVISGIDVTSYNDRNVVVGVEYKYNVVAIDKYGLTSEESENILITLPKE